MNALRDIALATIALVICMSAAVADANKPHFRQQSLQRLPQDIDPRIWSARSDGQRFAYVARQKSTYVAVFDGKRMGPYRHVSALPHDDLYFVASKYGRVSRRENAYSASDGQIILGSKLGEKGPYQKIVWLSLPERDAVVYKAQIRNKWFLHHPGHVSDPFDAIEDVHFVADGAVLIARARIDGRWLKLVNGRSGHPIDLDDDHTLVSSDGRLVAYVAHVNGKRHVVLNGKLGHVLARDTVPLMSPDQHHIAYIGSDRGKEFVALDNKAYDARATEISNLGWSDARNSPIYTAHAEGQFRLYVGNDLETYSDREIAFGSGGMIIATVAGKRVQNETTEWWQIGRNVDAPELQEGEPALPVRIHDHRILFSPDGKRWAYFAERIGDGIYLIVDGKPEKLEPVGEIDFDSLVWSPDSAYAAYLEHHGDQVRVMQSAPASWLASRPSDWFGARTGDWFDEVENGIRFARDDRLVYKGRIGSKWYLVVGSRKSQGFDGVGPIIFGPKGGAFSTGLKKGTEYALINHKTGSVVEQFEPIFGHSGDPIYLAKDDDRTFCVVGFFRQKRFDDIARSRMVLHPTRDAVAYAAREGDMWLVMGNTKSDYKWDHVSTPIYSPDGEHLAYTAEIEDQAYLMLDEEAIGPFDMVEAPVFSDDSQHVAFLARKGRALTWEVKKLLDSASDASPEQVAQKTADKKPDA